MSNITPDSIELKKDQIKRHTFNTLHIIILILCLVLITIISLDIFKNVPELTHILYMKVQFWICIIFIIDFFIELIISDNKKYYIKTHFVFFLVSIPYLSISQYFDIVFSASVEHFLTFIPLIRGGYALSIIVGWLTYSTISSLLITYLTLLLSTIYFCSLIFYSIEQSVNSMVQTFGDSVWWASMNVTTVGSNIFAVTSMGKIMSVLLAALGMMTFPIFTVYITSKVGEINDKKKKYFGIINKKDRIGREEKNSKNTNSPDNSDTNSSSDTSANK